MRILIVSATAMEANPIVAKLGPATLEQTRFGSYTFGGHAIDVLLTGVGMVATAAWCSRALAEHRYDLAFNFGVCGSFDRALQPGAVVHVVSDRLVELGAEDGDEFLEIAQLNLDAQDLFVNAAPPSNAALAALPAVGGVTVNTVHGSERTIAATLRRAAARVESMEGAAFMCACLMHGVPFAEVRAVSNVVERRNRQAWRMPDAIARLGESAIDIIRQA